MARTARPDRTELNPALTTVLAARQVAPETPVLMTRQGGAPMLSDLGTQTLCGTHDAGIERAAEVTPDCLRHTYVAFLVRQGIRFADLARLVGQISQERLAAYSDLPPPGARVSRDRVERRMPALRGLNATYPGWRRGPAHPVTPG